MSKSKLGNIKRVYPVGDFNPYKAMDHVYKHCLSRGAGHTVLVVGYTDRFLKDTVKALYHVLMSNGHQELPPFFEKEVETHTGTRIRFVKAEDSTHAQMEFQRHCEEASVVVLCNRYKSPEMISVIRETDRITQMYDCSRNNEKK